MNSQWALIMVLTAAFIASISQMMLRTSAVQEHKNLLAEYLNIRVVSSYVLLFGSTIINMFALVWLPYKVVPVVGTASYVFVVLISKIILKEKIDLKKWLGIGLVVAGIIIFNT